MQTMDVNAITELGAPQIIQSTVVPTHSDENTAQEMFLNPQPLDLHIGAILRDAPKFQRDNSWLESHDQQDTNDAHVKGVTDQQPRDPPAPEDNVQQLAADVHPQSRHTQMMEEITGIATAMEEMGIHIHNLNKPDMPAKESRQCRELLTNLFHQTKEDFWVFLQKFHDLGSQLIIEGDKTRETSDDRDFTVPNKSPGKSVTKRPRLTTNGIQSIEIIPSPEPDAIQRRETSQNDTKTVVTASPETAQNGTQTVVAASTFETFLTALPGTFPPSSTVGGRESEAAIPWHPSYIGSDPMSKSIIERDTSHVTKLFSQIVGGSFSKTGLELGVMEVNGDEWVDQFCDAHRYLNGILMAITLPKDLFLWHTRHFPVESDTWTKGALVRTVSIVTESPRYLHSYPLRHGRSLLSGKPSLLLHWNLEDIREPHVSARFKELVQVGSELENRIGAFSYKQLIVCVTIPWWICDKETSGDQKKAMEFLERMGIVGAIPVNEKSEGKVEETLWCPSRIKVGGSNQSVHAFIQETTYTGSPELEPAIAVTPTRFVVVTVRKGHVGDWVDAVQYALGMNSKSLRYSIPTEEAIDYSQLNKFYRSNRNPEPEPPKKE